MKPFITFALLLFSFAAFSQAFPERVIRHQGTTVFQSYVNGRWIDTYRTTESFPYQTQRQVYYTPPYRSQNTPPATTSTSPPKNENGGKAKAIDVYMNAETKPSSSGVIKSAEICKPYVRSLSQ